MTIDPFDLEQHPKIGLVNVMTGNVVCDPKVNVQQTFDNMETTDEHL